MSEVEVISRLSLQPVFLSAGQDHRQHSRHMHRKCRQISVSTADTCSNDIMFTYFLGVKVEATDFSLNYMQKKFP